jgi:hypothetical protein
MRATAIAANITASSVAKQFHRVLLLSALFVTASLNSWAQIVVSPASVTFTTKQVVGTTSASKPVTITNNGATAQPINPIVMSGDFTETDNCGSSIPGGGGTCTANIFFSPTLIGSISGAATIVDPSKNLLAFVGLTGTGLAPVTIAPASLSFGAVTIGTTSATKTFKITNNSAGPINVTGITPSSDYTVTNTGTCLSGALNHAANCTVTVDVTPTSAVDNGAIIVTDNAPNGTPIVVKLSASGTGGPTTPISLSKTSLTFKVVTGGVSATQTITVTNTSASAVTMGTTTASSDYAIVNNLCTGSLAAAATCTFGITFNPTFVGSIGGSAAVAYTGNNSPQLVNLSGSSLDDLTVAPPKLAFASQAIGTTSTAKAVKVSNNYTSAIALNSVVPSGDFQIQLSGTTCSLTGGTLAAAHSCNVQIQFAPTVAASIVGSLTVANAGSPNPLLVGLSGTGTGSSVTAVLNPASAHQGSSETIVITGTGTHFGPTTTVNFGADITPGTLTVNGPTSASMPITINNVAVTGSRSVTITTGAEVVKPTFTVIAGVPAVTLINPNTIRPTQAESVAVTGVFTNWVSGTTTASFGPGIAVGGGTVGGFGPVTVNSATSLTANLVTSGAAKSSNTVQIQTGSQTLTVKKGMFVQTCTANAPTVLQISPVANATNVPLNTQVQVQFSVPMNRSTFSLGNSGSTTVFFYDTTTGQEIPGTISVDASGTIATITPSVSLPAGRQFVTYLSYQNYVQDTCGNNLPSQYYYFTTAFSSNTTGPTLTGTSPVNGDTNIPLNGSAGATPMVLQFNTPIDPITVQTGFYMQTGGNTVAGNFTYATDDQTVTFTPINPLTASVSYTVSYSAQITDTAGNPLTNPGSFSFTTGTTGDTNSPSVVLVDPPSGTFGVGLNVTPHITFSEPINGLTIPGALNLVYNDSGVIIPTTVTVSADRLSATLTPTAPLLPNTTYVVSLCNYYCYTDIAGNAGYGSNTTFYTGTSTDTSATTVSTINPSKTQLGVPLNTLVTAVMSDDIDPTTVTNSSITLKQGTTNIPGTVTLAGDAVTLTFVPGVALNPSTVYNVSVGGFKDTEGNAVTTFTSSFTTGTTGYGNGSFALVSTSPASGDINVSVTSPVTFTMSNLINPASVNTLSVEVYVNATGDYVAGSYSVSGAAVTFTPLTPYPGNTLMGMYIYGLTDEAGNPANVSAGSFTTANTVDHTAPTVTISPANGTTNVGLNTQVVLTFSKSINPATITANTLALFNGDAAIGYGYTVSQDNRTIVVNPGGNAWTSGATVTIDLTSGIQDLSGDALANTNSQFTLTTALPNTAPQVQTMRPGNGATDVSSNTVVTLFTSAAMNPATITGALHVTDNGVLVSGAVQLFSNAQAIEFTPSSAFNPGDLIQVFLDSSALSADNVALSSFSGQFTVAGSPANTAASAQAANPINGATNVPLNTIIQVEYDQALAASTINSTNVTLYDNTAGIYLTPTLALVGNGQVINIAPTANLTAGDYYSVNISSAVTNTVGLAVNAFGSAFTAGTAADTAAPTIVSQAPTNNSTNIGTNTAVSVNFNKIINPISVTGSTIKLSAGATTEVPSSISFSPDYTRVSIIPLAPLPPSTAMTVAISGVTSEAGKSVANTTTNFTTAAQPDFNPPYVVNPSLLNGQTNVPVNSVFSMQFNKPMDIGSVDVASVGIFSNVYSSCYGQIPATVSWSADQTTIFIVPTTPLAVGTQYYLGSYSLTDLAGNPQQNFCYGFSTSFTANTNPPTVINTSPENTETQVPVNSPVQILFNEPIQPTSIGQITLKTGGNPVAVTPTFTDASQLLTLTPALPLLANANYTLTITGVKDTAGNQMTSTVTNAFTAGPTFDLLNPAVILTDPAPNMTSIGTNVAPRIVFSKRLNPLSVVSSSNELYYNGSVILFDNATGQYVPATVSMSADRLTATLTPNSQLLPNTSYQIQVAYQENYYDVAGNYGNSYQSTFVTGSGSDTTNTTVSRINPSNGQSGVPENFQIVAVMSDDIDPTTVNNSSITVMQGSNPIAGTVTLAGDGVTLTFVLAPTAVINPNTVYNVSVGGFKDTEGNAVTTSNTTFTTGSTTYGNGSFTLVSTSPANGATGVSVTSPVTFNMNNLINAASVNPNTVEVYVNATSQIVAGTYSVSGASVTFTPLSKYPASTVMGMYVYGLTDEAGNPVYCCGWTFTTTNTVDTTPPTVTITPANGTTNAGLNTQVVLTFSKSINPATITASSVNLLNGDVPLNPATSISGDNRTVVLNYNSSILPAGATLTVTATNLIKDLASPPNALANTTSQFITTPAVLNSAPSVLSMRPGSGATGVPTNTVITLFTSAPMNSGSATGALHVSQNGVIISGTANVASNGQSIEFTPSSALSNGASIQVFLDSTAQDIYGNYLSYFSGQFTVAGSPTNTASSPQAANPVNGATNVPLNTIIQVQYDQALAASTINSSNVTLYDNTAGTSLTPTLSLVGNGQVINIAPTSNLTASDNYTVNISSAVTNTVGLAVNAFSPNFTAGTAVDTAKPTITTVAPPNLATNIGTNAGVTVNFNKAINPISVTGSSIQLSGGSVTEVPSSVSFTPDYTRTMIVPQAPLPSSTLMTIVISGVTSEAGVAVTSKTTTFTTMAGADFIVPYVVNPSVQSGQTVGTNAAFAMQFSEPMDIGSIDVATVGIFSNVYYSCYGQIPATVSWSADQTTIFIVPTSPLTAGTTYYLGSYSLTDLAGNPQQSFCVGFNTGTGTDTAGPVVQRVSPPSGFTAVPINAPVQILFNKAISGASLGGVTLKRGTSVIPITVSLFDGDQGIQLLPLVPLATSVLYTINVTGVKDITGNAQSSFPSQSFTTGTGTDLVPPIVVSTNPTSGQTGVPDNTTVQVVFSEAMDPASFDQNTSFVLYDPSSNVVPATITFSADYKTVTLHPNATLISGVTYTMYVGWPYVNFYLYDLGGNALYGTYFSFTTL